MQFPSASSERLMFAPSLNRSPLFSVFEARSLPARSIKESLLTFFDASPGSVCSTCTYKFVIFTQRIVLFLNTLAQTLTTYMHTHSHKSTHSHAKHTQSTHSHTHKAHTKHTQSTHKAYTQSAHTFTHTHTHTHTRSRAERDKEREKERERDRERQREKERETHTHTPNNASFCRSHQANSDDSSHPCTPCHKVLGASI